jgi:ceramide glucosyltransferase
MMTLFHGFGLGVAALSVCGALYALLAALLMGRFMRARAPMRGPQPPVTILKPLYRGEPGLKQNLESFFAQDYAGKVQIVFGVHDADDPALEAVRSLQRLYPDVETVIVADDARSGVNGKVSNLVNMVPSAAHDILVLSDSDISVRPDWLAKVVAALGDPGVGLVTCLYTGRTAPGESNGWTRLSAMGTSYDFLPNVVVGTSLGLAEPCMGSTIALPRAVLEEIGGFAAFADFLADDYEIGQAVRARGHKVAIPALFVAHTAQEQSFAELLRHELRWMRTIRLVDPLGHAGSFITFTVPLALVAAVLLDFRAVAVLALALALVSRLFLKLRIDAIFGEAAGPAWLLPVRDLASFSVFVTSLFGATVHWRDDRFSVAPAGVMSQS